MDRIQCIKAMLMLIIFGLFLCWVVDSFAGEVSIQMDFAYNGGDTTQGFNFYQENSEGIESKLVQISGPDVRTWGGTIQIEPGRSLYYLTAYGADWESNRSNAYPFEYIESETSANPPPTIIIKFN